jgi:hypothetical protein
MFSYKENPTAKIVEITIDGRITKESFQELASLLEDRIRDWGHVNILEDFKSLEGGIEMGAIWEDLKFGYKNLRKFPKCAVVTDKNWVGPVVNVLSPLFPIDVRRFPADGIEEARSWLSSGTADAETSSH